MAIACGDSSSSEPVASAPPPAPPPVVSVPHAAATGASKDVSFQWSLNFVDTTTFAVGSSVSGSVSTQGSSAPVNIAGTITSNIGDVLALNLANDTPSTESQFVLGSLNMSTGKFFGGIFSPNQAVPIEGLATLTVKGSPCGGISPQIATVSPTSLSDTDRTITITGTGFRSTQGTSTVTFSGQPVIDFLSVLSWSDTRIVAELAGFDNGNYPIHVTVGGVPSNPVTINIAGSVIPPFFSSDCPPTTDRPVVVAFTVNGVEHRVIESGPAVLVWQVRNASGVHVQRLSGPGPAFNRTFAGGGSVTGAATLQFTSASCPDLDGCQDTIYRLTAEKGCSRTEAHVTVRQVTSERIRDLINMQTTILQRFDGHGLPTVMDAVRGFIVPAHQAPSARPRPLDNLCFMNEGLPYLVLVSLDI